MSLIDCHVHLYPTQVNASPEAWAAAAKEKHWALLCARTRKNGKPVQAFPEVGELLKQMDQAGVERAILQGWYWEHHDTAVFQNKFYRDCIRAHPDRLSACGTLHPETGFREMEATLNWLKAEGFCGLGELSPHSQLFAPDCEVWQSVLELAAKIDLPVLLHVTEAMTKEYPGRVLTPLEDFVRMAERHRETTFVLAHWGALLPKDPVFGARIRNLKNVFYDTAASPLLYPETVFQDIVSAVGADRVMFGSDYPLNLFPREENVSSIGRFTEQAKGALCLEEDRARVFSGTARTVFKL